MAFTDGNISGKSVADFGTGNGILAVGAILLGASRVTAYDSDPDMVNLTRANTAGMNVDAVLAEIGTITEKFDTVLMNPPWGDSTSRLDREFIMKAAESAQYLYAIHNLKSIDYLEKLYQKIGRIEHMVRVTLDVPRIYKHHTRERAPVEGVLFSVRFE